MIVVEKIKELSILRAHKDSIMVLKNHFYIVCKSVFN